MPEQGSLPRLFTLKRSDFGNRLSTQVSERQQRNGQLKASRAASLKPYFVTFWHGLAMFVNISVFFTRGFLGVFHAEIFLGYD